MNAREHLNSDGNSMDEAGNSDRVRSNSSKGIESQGSSKSLDKIGSKFNNQD